MTTEMHKAPSVAHSTGTSGDNATSVARYELSTSEGGRRYVADFFARELRRHDFARYITTTLAADFACALAQHLAATGKQKVGAFPWENLPSYLIDKCEGDTISEEGIQRAVADMAKDARYCPPQQVGEVQGDARAQFEAWAKGEGWKDDEFARYSGGRCTTAGEYHNSHLEALWYGWKAALAARQSVAGQHPDDHAVDAFATTMKAKMAAARAKGRGGWEDPAQCSADDLSRMLREHLEKGDPRDVANFCMMLHQRGEAIVPHAMQVPDNEIVRQILGRPNFACIELAGALRLRGDEIPRHAESEQAAVLLFLLNSYLELPDRWHDNVRDKLRRIDSQRDAAPGVGDG